jgi:hypothetical protein
MEQEMNTITVEDVVNAFESTGCKPARCCFMTKNISDETCLCGLSAVYKSRIGDVGNLLDSVLPDDQEEKLGEALGLHPDFVRGFIYGWDYDSTKSDFASDAWREGYKVGHEAYRTIRSRFGNILFEHGLLGHSQ